jgi:hypothetical protein
MRYHRPGGRAPKSSKAFTTEEERERTKFHGDKCRAFRAVFGLAQARIVQGYYSSVVLRVSSAFFRGKSLACSRSISHREPMTLLAFSLPRRISDRGETLCHRSWVMHRPVATRQWLPGSDRPDIPGRDAFLSRRLRRCRVPLPKAAFPPRREHLPLPLNDAPGSGTAIALGGMSSRWRTAQLTIERP